MIVTDRRLAPGGDVVAQVAAALAGAAPGQVLVQLREKDLGGRALVGLARALVALGAPVLVNDRVDVALAAGAAGVHLPEDGMDVAAARALLPAGAIVGASVHSAEAAVDSDADVVVLGPIWDTPGKLAVGPAVLAAAAARRPVWAIGGVDATRAASARAAGAAGVAVIRAVMAAPDPAAAVRALLGG
jgi:thiamine-phosphate pyrophosphorylase